MQFRHSWISPDLVQSLRSTGSPALSILRSVVIWIECAISLQVGSPVCILIGELDRVEFAVPVVDLAGEVGNQYLRHIGGIVGAVGFLAEVLAFGGHVHVMAVEHLLNPLGLLDGQAGSLDLILFLVLLVVERGLRS